MISSSDVGSSFLVLWEDIGILIFGFRQFLVQFLHITTVFFRFWCPVQFAGFLQLSLWFSVFVNNNGIFSDLSRTFYGFSGFAKEFKFPIITLKLQFQALYSDDLTKEYMTSLVSLAAIIWVVTAAKQTVKS